MIYLYLNKNKIKILYLKKTLLKQEETAFFEKTYQTNILENNKSINVDLLASAVKEAISSVSEKKINENQIILILPQEFFYFFRTEVPSDIAETAINSFITDKISSLLSIIPEDIVFDYFVKNNNQEKIINFFGIEKEILNLIQQAFSLIDLKIANILPETLVYYKLFEKTLKTDKKENILYMILEKDFVSGYLFDNFGLIEKNIFFEKISEEKNHLSNLKKIIKHLEEEKKIKLNRLIISGTQSENIRQDTFTKDVGVWTNLLKRIIPNFYDQYIKMLVVDKNQIFPILIYDVCFGAFVFLKEEKFSILKNQQFSFKKSYSSNIKTNDSSKKEIFLFAFSFLVSFGLFILISNLKNLKTPSFFAKITPTITPSPIPSPTPTPSFKKEDLKIQILNGSGVAGKASEMKKILKDKGYDDIVTGNADNFDYKTTEIQTKKSKSQASEMIKEDLKDYISSFKETLLDENKAPDVIIIFGSDFK
ncbi:MAG: LytR C-terminal domain-containing protein [Patescibacteria group bacterium]|nr:LytR C-terminal domain-containing protein [Patescibacteria group bacterium]